MPFKRLFWSAYYRLRGLRAKAFLFYYQRVQGLSRVQALEKLIFRSMGNNQ